MTSLGSVHLAAAAALAVLGLAAGAWGASLAAPLAGLLAVQGLAIRRGPGPATSRRSVGLGIAVLVFGAGLLVAGRASGLIALAAGIAVIVCGTHLALATDPSADLPRRDPWLHLGVATDEAIRFAIELASVARRGPEYDAIAAEARVGADRNRDEGWLNRPERAHPIPPPLEKPELERCQLSGFGPAEAMHFASEFEPQDPEIRSEYLAAVPNRTAHAFLVRRGDKPRPTLVFVHGYGLGRMFLDARLLGLPQLARELDLDLALFVLPLHGLRAIGLRSGAGIFDGRPLWTNAALAQAVWDLRRLAGFLHAAGAPGVGLFGVSLGGYVAAVHASVDDALSCVVTMNAPASLDALFWRQLPPWRAAAARAAGLTPRVLEHAWARHAPLRMRPQVPHAARLVIGGLADRIVPPDQVSALWEHWGQPPAHWYPGTHVVWSGRSELRVRLADHLRANLSRA